MISGSRSEKALFAWTSRGTAMAEKLIPTDVAPELEGVSDKAEAQEIIKRNIYKALSELSQNDLPSISQTEEANADS